MSKDNNRWKNIKQYINSIEKGNLFTRKELIEKIYNESDKVRCYTRIDVLRRQLELNGFINKTNKSGVFIKLHDIPIDLTTNELYLRAYNDPIIKNQGSIFDYL